MKISSLIITIFLLICIGNVAAFAQQEPSKIDLIQSDCPTESITTSQVGWRCEAADGSVFGIFFIDNGKAVLNDKRIYLSTSECNRIKDKHSKTEFFDIQPTNSSKFKALYMPRTPMATKIAVTCSYVPPSAGRPDIKK